MISAAVTTISTIGTTTDTMPIYEFICQDCQKLTSVFVRSVSSDVSAVCSHCKSANLKRAVSRVSIGRTESQILEQYGVPEPGQGPDAYKDPRQIGRWVEKRFDEMGMELPPEARRMIDAAREGEFPEPVKDL
jgi:putative FmdB family regulatory protein